MQKFFIKCSQLELESVLSEIKSHITALMTDTYANYMFQTLIQRCTPEQRLFILQQVNLNYNILTFYCPIIQFITCTYFKNFFR